MAAASIVDIIGGRAGLPLIDIKIVDVGANVGVFSTLVGTRIPGVRITAKSFGKDRRLPITNRYGAPRRP